MDTEGRIDIVVIRAIGAAMVAALENDGLFVDLIDVGEVVGKGLGRGYKAFLAAQREPAKPTIEAVRNAV